MASPDISFDQIPSSIRKPGKYFEFNTKLAVRTLPPNEIKALIIAQRIAAGSVAALVPTSVFSDADAAGYFGNGSLAHLMARAAIKANNYLDLTVIALDDVLAGVAATGTVTITGPATAEGVIDLYVGTKDVQVAVNNGDSATIIAAAVAAAVNALPDLPVTAAAALGVVTLTAKNKGLCGNQIPLGYISTNISGVTVAIVAMANGAADPDIQAALTVVFGTQYDIIITPYNNDTSLAELKTHLETVSNAIEQRPGIGVYAVTGILAAATTLAGQLDEGRLLCAYHRYSSSTIIQSMPCELAAAMAATMAFEEDPARPLNTLALIGIAPANIADRLSRTEQENLLYNGVTPIEVGPGETVQIVRAISTYTVDAQGVADISLLDITTIRTLDYVRAALRTRIALRFPREKLSTKTPPRVRSELIDVLKQLESLEIVENVTANLPGIIVELDSQDPNRLDAKIPVDVVNGLHVFAGRIDLIL